METVQLDSVSVCQKARRSSVILTTIYELIKTVIDVADPHENNLINEVAKKLLAKSKPCT
jgi:hypothetical protein